MTPDPAESFLYFHEDGTPELVTLTDPPMVAVDSATMVVLDPCNLSAAARREVTALVRRELAVVIATNSDGWYVVDDTSDGVEIYSAHRPTPMQSATGDDGVTGLGGLAA